MKLEDLFESENKQDLSNKIKTRRGARITLGHLLKLRQIREKKKLEKLKDMELYQIMYSGDEGGGAEF